MSVRAKPEIASTGAALRGESGRKASPIRVNRDLAGVIAQNIEDCNTAVLLINCYQ